MEIKKNHIIIKWYLNFIKRKLKFFLKICYAFIVISNKQNYENLNLKIGIFQFSSSRIYKIVLGFKKNCF